MAGDLLSTNVYDHGAAAIDLPFTFDDAGRSRASFCSSVLSLPLCRKRTSYRGNPYTEQNNMSRDVLIDRDSISRLKKVRLKHTDLNIIFEHHNVRRPTSLLMQEVAFASHQVG